jgi:hypothetical protein
LPALLLLALVILIDAFASLFLLQLFTSQLFSFRRNLFSVFEEVKLSGVGRTKNGKLYGLRSVVRGIYTVTTVIIERDRE